MLSAIQKGYRCDNIQARRQIDPVVHCNVFNTMHGFCFIGPPHYLGGGRPQPVEYVTYSLEVLIELEDADGVVAKLSEVGGLGRDALDFSRDGERRHEPTR